MRWRKGLEMEARGGRLVYIRETTSPIDNDPAANPPGGCLTLSIIILMALGALAIFA